MAKKSNKFSSKKKQTPEERAEIDREREAAYKAGGEAVDAGVAEAEVNNPEEGDVAVIDKLTTEPGFDDVPDIEKVDLAPNEGDQAAASIAEEAAEAEVEADNAKPNSVVAPKFKDKYLSNARALGIPGKAAKRSNWDWLAQRIAAICLDDKHKISIERFKGLLDVNGVDHSKWTNRNKGWEGRFRMTGRVALQKVVANSGKLVTLEGEEAAPSEFIARFKTKE